MRKLFISTYVDHGETCDGKSRVLGVDQTREEAMARVRNDIENWADVRPGMPIVVDFDKMSAKYNWETPDITDDGCEWNIEEVEVNFV